MTSNLRKQIVNSFFRTLLLSLLFLLGENSLIAQQTKKIQILGGDVMEYDESTGLKVRRIIGNVAFKHDNVLMYCDSAWLYDQNNSLDAYGHVHIVRGDSINCYGDYLKYDGNQKLAELHNNVKLIDKEMTLFTDVLWYDTGKNIGNYTTGGKIINKDNTLTSRTGYYYGNQKNMYFKHDVLLVNPKYTMTCDTLKFNPPTEVAYFMSPTKIKSKNNYIYCEDGWYDTKKEKAEVKKNSYLENKEKRLKGDYVYYDGKLENGRAKDNVVLTDTSQKLQIDGDYGEFNQKKHISFVTGHTLLKQFAEKDTFFLHADTLKAVSDSTDKNRVIYAFHRVKFYKRDVQGQCDSLIYSQTDSLIKMFRKPVLWNEANQITANYIELKVFEGTFYNLKMDSLSLIVSQQDSMFNQISGLNMKGYFQENKLRRIDVKKNGHTIYFPKDDKKNQLIGLNKVSCMDIIILLDTSSRIQKLTFFENPESTLLPMNVATESDKKMKEFIWLDKDRPKKRQDVFNW